MWQVLAEIGAKIRLFSLMTYHWATRTWLSISASRTRETLHMRITTQQSQYVNFPKNFEGSGKETLWRPSKDLPEQETFLGLVYSRYHHGDPCCHGRHSGQSVPGQTQKRKNRRFELEQLWWSPENHTELGELRFKKSLWKKLARTTLISKE